MVIYCYYIIEICLISAIMASSPLTTALRPRVRLPKAKPNIMGGARRSTSSTAVTSPKPAEAANELKKEFKNPPPVRRVVQLEISKPAQLLNEPTPNSLPSALVISNDESECIENVDFLSTSSMPLDVSAKEASPKKLPQDPEIAVSQTTMPSNNTKKVRKISSRTGSENKEKDEVIKVRHKKGQLPPDRAKMTMFDLIYWNPESNPMTYEDDEHRPPLAIKEANTSVLPTENAERLAEEAVDDPEFIGEGEGEGDIGSKENEAEKMEESMPVPQVKIGPDGNIILDEQSLVIETTASKIDISSSPVVYGRQNNTTYASFRNKKQTKTWSDKETAKFYVALSSVGTDFSMMANLFPKRERKELKLKFKREEKFNRELVDRAIRDRQQYDLSIFDESDEELENQGEKLMERTIKSRKKQCSGQARERKSENNGENGCDKEQRKCKKPRGRKRLMQEEDDSDYGEAELACTQELESTDILTKQLDTLQSNSCDKEAVESPITESTINSEETGIEKENSDDVEMLEGVLKQTRSGRQPKKRALFTIVDKEPKKRIKKSKPYDNTIVSTPTECVDTCTSEHIASKDVSRDETVSIDVCTGFPLPFSAQEVDHEKFPNGTCTTTQPKTPLCGNFFHDIASVEPRETDLVDTCNNYPIANDIAKYDEEDEQDEENCQEYRILEGVLKKTRSGRQPKMKSVFTIDNLKHEKEIKERGTTKQTICPTKVTQSYALPINPLPTVLATSPGELYLLAEKPAEDGSQVVHLYMMSPPLQPSPVSIVESPAISDHDYVLQNLVNIPVNIRGTTTELDPTIAMST